MTVNSAASGDRVHCAFIGDRRMSRHLLYATLMKRKNFPLLALI